MYPTEERNRIKHLRQKYNATCTCTVLHCKAGNVEGHFCLTYKLWQQLTLVFCFLFNLMYMYIQFFFSAIKFDFLQQQFRQHEHNNHSDLIVYTCIYMIISPHSKLSAPSIDCALSTGIHELKHTLELNTILLIMDSCSYVTSY